MSGRTDDDEEGQPHGPAHGRFEADRLQDRRNAGWRGGGRRRSRLSAEPAGDASAGAVGVREAAQNRLPSPPHGHRRGLRPLVRAHHPGGGRAHQRDGRHRRAADRADHRGRRHRSEARRRGGRETGHPAQRRLHLRHAVLARRDRLGAARRRAQGTLFRRQRGLSRRLGIAQPLCLPAGYHRCPVADPGDLGLDAGQPRQEGCDDLSRLCVRLQSPRLLHGGGRGPRRLDHGEARHSADRDVLYQILRANPVRHRGALPRHGRPRRLDLRARDGRALRLEPAADLRLHGFARGRRHGQSGLGIPRRKPISGRPSRATPTATRRDGRRPSATR